jgi:hypothetical protein
MPVVLKKANALFLHVPKTGGSFVFKALQELGIEIQHPTLKPGVSVAHALPRHVEGEFDFAFLFVREPMSWYRSWWRFQMGREHPWDAFEPWNWHPQRGIERYADDDFERWLRALLYGNPGHVSSLYERYVDDVTHGVGFVGRHERLADDLAAVLAHLGYDVTPDDILSLPKTNVSRGPQVPPSSPELEALVRTVERRALERFWPDAPVPDSIELRAPTFDDDARAVRQRARVATRKMVPAPVRRLVGEWRRR